MKVNRVRLTNFLVFAGVTFEVEFCEGINVLIGSNATGKTTLLKSIYGACEFSNKTTHPDKAEKFQDYFSSSKKAIREIMQKKDDGDFGLVQVFSGEHEFHYRAWNNGIIKGDWLKLGIKYILIPSKDMLSHSKGLVATSLKYGVPFDSTLMPIHTMGDGVRKLLHIVLIMLTKHRSILLLDEVENGLHYSLHTKFWEMISTLAKQEKCQIVATTHSYECINGALEGTKSASLTHSLACLCDQINLSPD